MGNDLFLSGMDDARKVYNGSIPIVYEEYKQIVYSLVVMDGDKRIEFKHSPKVMRTEILIPKYYCLDWITRQEIEVGGYGTAGAGLWEDDLKIETGVDAYEK